VDGGERNRGFPCLVGLKMADEMPPDWSVGCFADLLQGFLYLVLAEVALAGAPGGADVVGAEGFRHRDQRDLAGFTAGAAGSRADPCVHGFEVLRDVAVDRGQGAIA
jgi:hypothetical protein